MAPSSHFYYNLCQNSLMNPIKNKFVNNSSEASIEISGFSTLIF